MSKFAVLFALSAVLLIASAAQAIQYSYLDPNYVQEIYTGPLVGGPGMAWTNSNNLLTRNGASIIEYSPTQNTVHQGTNLHSSIITHNITGLSSSGFGMSRGLDGYIYTATSGGLQRFNPSNWAAPAQSLAGTVGGAGYGITTLPDGRIAYCAGSVPSDVYIYDPSSGTNTWIYTASSLIDDIEAGPSGVIALAEQSSSGITIIGNTGTVIKSFSTPHFPDGLAFGDGITTSTLYSNNNDGTISRYVLGPGFTGVPVITDIATGSAAYGDLASVGPDCAFYVSQFDNGGMHGSTAGIGTHWDNGVTNNEASIIRISLRSGQCGFNCPTGDTPEPASLLLVLTGLVPLLHRPRFRGA